jgi:hypothetical protein
MAAVPLASDPAPAAIGIAMIGRQRVADTHYATLDASVL